MPVPLATTVLYSDLLTAAQIDEMYPGSRHPDIVSDSEHFPTVESESFDFIVANHVLEHVTGVLAALIEWHRMLKPNGLLLLSVPDKRYTFDHPRKRTTLEHLEDDYRSEDSPEILNECHLLEWAEHVEGLRPGTPEFTSWVAEQKARGYAVHNHVWVLQDVLRIVQHLPVRFELVKWSNTSVIGNEFTLLLRKGADHGKLRLAMLSAFALHPLHELVSRIRRAVKRSRARVLRRLPGAAGS